MENETERLALEETRDLVDRLLDGRMTMPEKERLELLVAGSPRIAELYIEMVHLWCNLPLHLPHVAAFDFTDGGVGSDVLDGGVINGQMPGLSMDESLVLPAIRESDAQSDEPLTLPAPARIQRPSGRSGILGSRWSRTAAVLLIGMVIFWAVNHGRRAPQTGEVAISKPSVATIPVAVPPAIITATANTGAGDTALSPGSALTIGQTVQFSSGAMELKFASGAIATIEAPARFRVLSPNSMVLDDGSLAAHVPESAHGFRVDGPGLWVVDRGTNFGIRASLARATSQVCIFNGIVEATGVNAAGEPVGSAVRAVAGQALSHHVTDAELVPAVYQPERFIRQISDMRIPVQLHNTGEKTAPGDPDPNWTVITVPNDPAWKAKSASVVRDLSPMYGSDFPDAKWIGVNGQMDNQPTGTFVFQTTVDLGVDLGDADLATIQVGASIAADDCVTDIKVNGISTGASNSPDNPVAKFIITDVKLPAVSWHKGVNQVQVEVLNRPNANVMNCMLLQIRWNATMLARVHRAEPVSP